MKNPQVFLHFPNKKELIRWLKKEDINIPIPVQNIEGKLLFLLRRQTIVDRIQQGNIFNSKEPKTISNESICVLLKKTNSLLTKYVYIGSNVEKLKEYSLKISLGKKKTTIRICDFNKMLIENEIL